MGSRDLLIAQLSSRMSKMRDLSDIEYGLILGALQSGSVIPHFHVGQRMVR